MIDIPSNVNKGDIIVKKKTKNEKEREKPKKETVRINFRMKKSKVKDGKEKSVKLRNEKEDDNELDENSDSTSTTSERNTHQDLLNPLPSVIPQVLRVPDKKILPGATTRLVEQPYWYTTKIVEEERPDLAGKEGKLSLDKEEVELLDKYIREKSELFIGDLIITDDNMDEDDRRYSRYEVQLKYNEGRYSAVYIIARQTCAKNVFKEDGTLFAMKTGLRRNSATIVLRMKRELRTMQELNKGKCPYVPMVLDHGKVCDMPFIG
uniref:Protein kinase domain-containing protein n=1 Tax=Heterorhabditis bacteriophora TaxID=37862 RepID=A0A1I7X0R5_HETBA